MRKQEATREALGISEEDSFQLTAMELAEHLCFSWRWKEPSIKQVERGMKEWTRMHILERRVCPFAAEMKSERLRIHVCTSESEQEQLTELLKEGIKMMRYVTGVPFYNEISSQKSSASLSDCLRCCCYSCFLFFTFTSSSSGRHESEVCLFVIPYDLANASGIYFNGWFQQMASIQLKRLFEELGREKQIAGDAGKGIMVEPLEMLPMHPLTMQARPGSASN